MTFEEFFNKKRIDLGMMRDADPALYSEFKSHFETMGEKSFDHTKKFWFNKLRHLYHLAEPVKKAVTQLETQIASQAEPLSSPTIEQGSAAAQPTGQQEAKSAGLPKPGFKPRSIPAAAAKAADAPKSEETDVPFEKPAAPVSKPGFRPRSIPAAAAKPVDEPTPAEPDTTAEKPAVPVSKPGFRPRNVKPVSGELSEDAQNTASRPGQDIPSGASQGNAANVPRPAYKPRFNVKNVASKATTSGDQSQDEKSTEVKGEESIPSGVQDAASASAGPDDVSKEGNEVLHPAISSAPKPAYKPRFNVKTVTQKNPEGADSAAASESDLSMGTAPDMSPEANSSEESRDSKIQESLEVKDPAQTDEAKAAVPKPAYKPRFNVKTAIPKAVDEPPIASDDATPVEPASSSEDGIKSAEKGPEESSKSSYKPRFNIKNIKPKE